VDALRDLVSWQPLVLMILGALLFAVGHPKPTGPIGMAFFLAGVVWLELRPRREEAGRPVPAS
jgi:drug/metabolite transporter (DMT)-like permease